MLDTLLRRLDDLRLSLANAVLNIAQLEEDLAEARKAEQRVRGAITLISELINAPEVPDGTQD